MILYRLTLAKYVDNAFSGEGSRRVGGRWTPAGYPAVYTARSIALTVLETLVHVDSAIMPKHLVIRVDVPESTNITSFTTRELPNDWRETPAPTALQQIGRDWLDAGESALLQIPSVVVPQENNVIINPLHPDFKKLTIGQPDSFSIDARLLE
ncbi:MAG: RES family NAD+ phosphorylase [Gammaproteobacteria bacterium]|nr:RES family NAD+ phosphorylase [Gammaproteobacteria bacterium]